MAQSLPSQQALMTYLGFDITFGLYLVFATSCDFGQVTLPEFLR